MRRRFGLLSASLVSLACAHGGRPPPQEAPPPSVAAYYPLAVGNAWTYDVAVRGQHQTQTVRIVGARDGYYEDSTGAHLRADAFGIRDEQRYLLRGPLELGKSWECRVSADALEHYTVLSAGEPCKSPAGRFETCVTVEARELRDPQTALINQVTFARGVGIVRVKGFLEKSGQRQQRSELTLRAFEVASAEPAPGVPTP